MSSKINISAIVINHIKTLKDSNGKFLPSDFFTLFIMPIILSIVFIYKNWTLKSEALGTLVNFGSIFSALLISVLIMIYDQSQKLDEQKEKINTEERKENSNIDTRELSNRLKAIEIKQLLIMQMYHNISYCILISLLLVVSALFYQSIDNTIHWITNIALALNVFFTANLVLTTLMALKRTYNLMTSPLS